MRYLFIAILVFTSFTDPITRIAKVNGLKNDAKEAVETENLEAALLHYIELVDSLGIEDDNLKMNMANTAFNLSYGDKNYLQVMEMKRQAEEDAKQLEGNIGTEMIDSLSNAAMGNINKYQGIAETKYSELIKSADKTIASSAYNQQGIIAYLNSETDDENNMKELLFGKSIEHFRDALRQNPMNEAARYNYELLKKIKRERDQKQDEDLKPSEYAKMMKARADDLRQKGDFMGAMDVMLEALQNDETTEAYRQFMEKLKEIAEI